jgi:hypothetical protein
MTRTSLALAALLAATATADAGTLVRYQAESIDLGRLHGFAYYSEKPDGFHVVATLVEGEAGLPVRFEATLADRQKLTISVPGKVGEEATFVEFSRSGDRLFVARTDRSEGL